MSLHLFLLNSKLRTLKTQFLLLNDRKLMLILRSVIQNSDLIPGILQRIFPIIRVCVLSLMAKISILCFPDTKLSYRLFFIQLTFGENSIETSSCFIMNSFMLITFLGQHFLPLPQINLQNRNTLIKLIQLGLIIPISVPIVRNLLLQPHNIGFALNNLILGVPHILIILNILFNSLDSFPHRQAVLVDEGQPVIYVPGFSFIQGLDVVQDVVVVQERAWFLLHFLGQQFYKVVYMGQTGLLIIIIMAQSDLIEKLSGRPLKQSILYDQKRLKAIQAALASMKQINKAYLKKFQLQDIWHRVNIGLIKNNAQTSLQNIIQFKMCQSNKPQKTYFNPFAKKPITICYNKFLKQEEFNQALSYNIILYYDAKTKKDMNWNDLEHVVRTNVRAIHLSDICRQEDRACIRKELQTRVFEKERFKGINLVNLSQTILEGLQDVTPISQTG